MKRYVKSATDNIVRCTYDEYIRHRDKLMAAVESAFPGYEFRWDYTTRESSPDMFDKEQSHNLPYYLEAYLFVDIDDYLKRSVKLKNIMKVTPNNLVDRVQKLLDRVAAQIDKSPRKIVYDVCKLMRWNMPTFIDGYRYGYKVKWGGHPFTGTQDDIDYINKQLGLHCYLTPYGHLVIAE